MVTPEILYLVLQMTLSMTRQVHIDEMLTYQGFECEKKHKDLDETEQCRLAHSKAEKWFHPAYYLTQKCVIPEHFSLLERMEAP